MLHFHGIFLEQDLMRIFDDKSMGERHGIFLFTNNLAIFGDVIHQQNMIFHPKTVLSFQY